MQINLVYFKRGAERKDIPLTKPVSLLGRRGDCDLQIPLMGVSRRHCELVAEEDTVIVRDLSSSNGTYVNGERVSEQQLNAGDRLQVGTVAFVIQIDGEPAKIAPPTKPKAAAPADQAVDVELAPDDDDAFAKLVMDDSSDDESPLDALESLSESDLGESEASDEPDQGK